jgi:hypothetical protein
MPTLAGQGITSGTITLYEQGDWFGDVRTNSSELIPNGTRVEVVVENVTLSGAVVHGGISGDAGRYQLAGRPEWSTRVAPRAYQSSGAVLRSTVFADVAREALGSSWQSLVVAPSEAKLGGHYERAGTNGNDIVLARDVLNSPGLSWYVRNDGVTVFGTRSSGTVTTEERILVSERNDAIGLRYVNCDDIAAFVPGLTFEGEVIGELSYLITPEDVSLQVWTRAASNAFSDLVRMVWRRLFPRVELQGLYSYSTAGVTSNGKHSLRSTGSRNLPDINLADAWTIAGHTAELVPGTRVLVSFADGNPAKPVIVAVDPSTLPTKSYLNADDSVELGGGTTDVVVDSASLQSFFTAVNGATGVAVPTGYTSTKVKA